MTTSIYTIAFTHSKFDITNIGNSGQPNCKMKYLGNPSPEEIVADANKTVVKL